MAKKQEAGTGPKKHHFLPQFYLSGFAMLGKPTHLWQIEKTSDAKSYLVNIRDAAESSNYHTISDSAGNRDSASVEQALSRLEKTQGELLERITGKSPLLAGDRRLLAGFVALMEMRVPPTKASVERDYKVAAEATQKVLLKGDRLERVMEAYRGPEFAAYPPGVQKAFIHRMREMIVNIRMPVKVSNRALLGAMFGLAQKEQFLAMIERMGVTVFEAPAAAYFVTGDTPVSRFYPRRFSPGQYGAGLANKNIQLAVPLSARFLACLHWSSATFEYRAATVSDVAEFNRRAVIAANKLVFAPLATLGEVQLVQANCRFVAGSEVSLHHDPAGGTCLQFSRIIPVFPPECYPIEGH